MFIYSSSHFSPDRVALLSRCADPLGQITAHLDDELDCKVDLTLVLTNPGR